MKSFVFLYPIPEYINWEIQNWSREEDPNDFRQKYRRILNHCIDVRYRQKGFGITYVLFDGHEISDVVDLRKDDKVIFAGLDFKSHTTELPDGTYRYPDTDYILAQLGDVEALRVAGFHMWDCVEKLAKNAHEKGIDTLVDEDLTEFFTFRIKHDDFVVDKYPNLGYNLRECDSRHFERFMDVRKERPWLWQDY